jgi:hypothetical protein
MRPQILIGSLVAAVIAVLILEFGMQVGAQSNYGTAWRGPGMMGGYGAGPGMTGPNMMAGYGYGMGPGMMGPSMMAGYGYGRGPGMMGPNMMAGYGYGTGPGMMGPNMMGGYGFGMGARMMGPQWNGGQTALNLSAADAKNYFESWLAWQGNPNLKLGSVTEKDADTIVVDIITKDKDALVQRFALNRHTGLVQPNEE